MSFYYIKQSGLNLGVIKGGFSINIKHVEQDSSYLLHAPYASQKIKSEKKALLATDLVAKVLPDSNLDTVSSLAEQGVETLTSLFERLKDSEKKTSELISILTHFNQTEEGFKYESEGAAYWISNRNPNPILYNAANVKQETPIQKMAVKSKRKAVSHVEKREVHHKSEAVLDGLEDDVDAYFEAFEDLESHLADWENSGYINNYGDQGFIEFRSDLYLQAQHELIVLSHRINCRLTVILSTADMISKIATTIDGNVERYKNTSKGNSTLLKAWETVRSASESYLNQLGGLMQESVTEQNHSIYLEELNNIEEDYAPWYFALEDFFWAGNAQIKQEKEKIELQEAYFEVTQLNLSHYQNAQLQVPDFSNIGSLFEGIDTSEYTEVLESLNANDTNNVPHYSDLGFSIDYTIDEVLGENPYNQYMRDASGESGSGFVAFESELFAEMQKAFVSVNMQRRIVLTVIIAKANMLSSIAAVMGESKSSLAQEIGAQQLGYMESYINLSEQRLNSIQSKAQTLTALWNEWNKSRINLHKISDPFRRIMSGVSHGFGAIGAVVLLVPGGQMAGVTLLGLSMIVDTFGAVRDVTLEWGIDQLIDTEAFGFYGADGDAEFETVIDLNEHPDSGWEDGDDLLQNIEGYFDEQTENQAALMDEMYALSDISFNANTWNDNVGISQDGGKAIFHELGAGMVITDPNVLSHYNDQLRMIQERMRIAYYIIQVTADRMSTIAASISGQGKSPVPPGVNAIFEAQFSYMKKIMDLQRYIVQQIEMAQNQNMSVKKSRWYEVFESFITGISTMIGLSFPILLPFTQSTASWLLGGINYFFNPYEGYQIDLDTELEDRYLSGPYEGSDEDPYAILESALERDDNYTGGSNMFLSSQSEALIDFEAFKVDREKLEARTARLMLELMVMQAKASMLNNIASQLGATTASINLSVGAKQLDRDFTIQLQELEAIKSYKNNMVRANNIKFSANKAFEKSLIEFGVAIIAMGTGAIMGMSGYLVWAYEIKVISNIIHGLHHAWGYGSDIDINLEGDTDKTDFEEQADALLIDEGGYKGIGMSFIAIDHANAFINKLRIKATWFRDTYLFKVAQEEAKVMQKIAAQLGEGGSNLSYASIMYQLLNIHKRVQEASVSDYTQLASTYQSRYQTIQKEIFETCSQLFRIVLGQLIAKAAKARNDAYDKQLQLEKKSWRQKFIGRNFLGFFLDRFETIFRTATNTERTYQLRDNIDKNYETSVIDKLKAEYPGFFNQVSSMERLIYEAQLTKSLNQTEEQLWRQITVHEKELAVAFRKLISDLQRELLTSMQYQDNESGYVLKSIAENALLDNNTQKGFEQFSAFFRPGFGGKAGTFQGFWKNISSQTRRLGYRFRGTSKQALPSTSVLKNMGRVEALLKRSEKKAKKYAEGSLNKSAFNDFKEEHNKLKGLINNLPHVANVIDEQINFLTRVKEIECSLSKLNERLEVLRPIDSSGLWKRAKRNIKRMRKQYRGSLLTLSQSVNSFHAGMSVAVFRDIKKLNVDKLAALSNESGYEKREKMAHYLATWSRQSDSHAESVRQWFLKLLKANNECIQNLALDILSATPTNAREKMGLLQDAYRFESRDEQDQKTSEHIGSLTQKTMSVVKNKDVQSLPEQVVGHSRPHGLNEGSNVTQSALDGVRPDVNTPQGGVRLLSEQVLNRARSSADREEAPGLTQSVMGEVRLGANSSYSYISDERNQLASALVEAVSHKSSEGKHSCLDAKTDSGDTRRMSISGGSPRTDQLPPPSRRNSFTDEPSHSRSIIEALAYMHRQLRNPSLVPDMLRGFNINGIKYGKFKSLSLAELILSEEPLSSTATFANFFKPENRFVENRVALDETTSERGKRYLSSLNIWSVERTLYKATDEKFVEDFFNEVNKSDVDKKNNLLAGAIVFYGHLPVDNTNLLEMMASNIKKQMENMDPRAIKTKVHDYLAGCKSIQAKAQINSFLERDMSAVRNSHVDLDLKHSPEKYLRKLNEMDDPTSELSGLICKDTDSDEQKANKNMLIEQLVLTYLLEPGEELHGIVAPCKLRGREAFASNFFDVLYQTGGDKGMKQLNKFLKDEGGIVKIAKKYPKLILANPDSVFWNAVLLKEQVRNNTRQGGWVAMGGDLKKADSLTEFLRGRTPLDNFVEALAKMECMSDKRDKWLWNIIQAVPGANGDRALGLAYKERLVKIGNVYTYVKNAIKLELKKLEEEKNLEEVLGRLVELNRGIDRLKKCKEGVQYLHDGISTSKKTDVNELLDPLVYSAIRVLSEMISIKDKSLAWEQSSQGNLFRWSIIPGYKC